MKKLLTAALLFASAFAFAEGYKDWFTPPNNWEGVKVPVKFVVNYEGSPVVRDSTVDINKSLNYMVGLIDTLTEGLPESAKNAFKVSRLALANSLYASCQAHMNKLKIDNLGAALEGVFVSTYGQYVDEDGNVISKSKSGVDTSKLRQQLLANKNSIIAGGKAAGGSENNPLTIVVTQKPYDEHQFEQHVANGRSLTSLHGWYGLSDNPTDGLDGADGWAFADRGYFLPYSNGKSSTLGWKKWNGWDSSCFSAGDDGGTGSRNNETLHLTHWNGGDGGCGENLQNLLTNKSERIASDRRKHYFLARYGENNAQTHDLHWVSMSESAMEVGGGDTEVDDRSVVTNENGQIALKGFEAAKPEQATDGAVLPFVGATSDDLQWTGIENFFSDSVFRKSSTTGKMLLNGTSETGKVKVLAMTGNGGDDQQIAALAFDNASIDGNPEVGGVVQLHGFDTAPSPYGGNVSFADALTNTATQITGMSVPVRVPSANGATVAYVPMGKIAGIPAAAVDNTTIEVNESDPQNKFLQLHGAAGDGITLAEGDVYQIGSDGKGKFAKLGADTDDATVEAANASIESYTGDDGGKYFRLRDWMINREGIPHLLGWREHALKYWTVDGSKGVDIDSQSGGEDIALSGYGDAADGAIPYAMKDGNGLGWLQGVDGRVPLLHTDGAPTSMAIGSSLDRANISAVPTLNVSGFTSGGNCNAKLNRMLSDPADSANRGAHQFMARYSGGGDPSVHWVGIDDIIAGGGAPVDDASITTNTAHGAVTSGNASIYGFADAPYGTTPIVSNVNGHKALRWGTLGSFGLTATKNGTGWTYSIKTGYFVKARTMSTASGITVSTTGYVYLKVPLGSGSASLVVESSYKSSDSSYTYILLYYCDVNSGVTDYRGAPHIQVWE